MTREEAIKELKILKEDYWDDDGYGHETKQYVNTILALDMAIEALQQEPCEDAISRQMVLDEISKVCFSRSREWIEFRINNGSNGQRDLIIKFIKEMPSVQPEQKTGHWILQPSNKEQGERDFIWWKCSECGQVIYSETEQDRQEYHAYCGRCGAKMLPTDSNCNSCKYQNEVDGSNCYECVKGIRNNYTADSESEIHCNCTDAEIVKSLIEDVEAVKELLPQDESEE